MKIVVTTITSQGSQLILGLQIWGPQKSWLKFATTTFDLGLATTEERRDVVRALSHDLPTQTPGIDEPLPLTWGQGSSELL